MPLLRRCSQFFVCPDGETWCNMVEKEKEKEKEEEEEEEEDEG